jgi:hypothetical protein
MMADVGAAVDGKPAGVATEEGLLGRYRDIRANPAATADDMYSAVMAANTPQSVFDMFRAGYNKITDATDAALAAVLQRLGALEGSSAFVTNQVLSTANLLSTYPPSAAYVGKYARVFDLYGSVDDVLRCRWDGANYRWVPQRADFNMTTSAAGSVQLVPLVTPPTVRTPATLTGAITFTPSTTNAIIGQRYRVVVTGGLGIYTATISGLIGSNLSLLGNSFKDIEYAASGWFGV